MEWSSSEFHVEVIPEGSSMVVRVVGEVDITTTSSLGAALEVAATSAQRIIVDMARVAFIDAAGISALLTAAALARANHGELVVRNPGTTARRVFEALSLTRRLPVEGTGPAAETDRVGTETVPTPKVMQSFDASARRDRRLSRPVDEKKSAIDLTTGLAS